jgi:hypothetical protein
MRCPTCGTENEPDSRFCGGCGARLNESVPPRASSQPPAKISAPQSRVSAPQPTSSGSPSRKPSRSLGASLSLAAANHRGGVIAVLLLIDVALAAAGAVLLVKAMTRASASPQADDNGSAGKVHSAAPQTPPPSPAPVPGPPSDAAITAIADPPVADAAVEAPPPADAGAARPRKKPDTRPTKKSGTPQETSAEKSAVDVAVARLRPEIERCHRDAGAPSGHVHIAFQILPDGSVTHVQPVENTTESQQLGVCVAAAVGSLSFPPHEGGPVDFVRPFEWK